MERTNFVTKLISGILFAAFAVYICVYAFKYFSDPYSTTTAVSYTMGDLYRVSGIIIRQESLFTTDESYVTITAKEGQKVAAGEPVATAYGSESQQKLDQQISQLTDEIDQLEKYAKVRSGSQETVTQESTVKSTIMEMNYALGRGELSSLEESVTILRSLLFSGDFEETSSKIAELQSQADTLKGQLGSAGKAISIDSAGIFSTNVDGYEGVVPTALDSITASELSDLIGGAGSRNSGALGKLATGLKWYFAAVVPGEKAEKLSGILDEGGSSVEAQLSGIGTATYKMTIERVDKGMGDECVVVLSCNYALGETLSARITEADIIFSVKTGIKTPREAIYQDEEGNYYIFTEKAMQAEQHYINIIYEYGDYCLVESSESDTNALREGAEIIVNAKNLYDGKVIAS